MDKEKIETIATVLSGLKHYEWTRIRAAIDKKFASESGKIVLSDTEAIARAIKLEF